MAKNIVLLMDSPGPETGIGPDGAPLGTNVVRLKELLPRGGSGQTVFYSPGATGGFWSSLWRPPTKRSVTEAYEYLMREFQSGDRIFLFGFGPSAYRARALAGVLGLVGLLRMDATELVGEAVDLYWRTSASLPTIDFDRLDLWATRYSRPGFDGRAADAVHFLGGWDTVRPRSTFRIEASLPWTTTLPNVAHVRHAVAIDDFHPVVLLDPGVVRDSGRDVEEVWFAGTQADMGTAFRYSHGHGVADIALQWMAREAAEAGLLLEPGRVEDFNGRVSEASATAPIESIPAIRSVAGRRSVEPPDARLHRSVQVRMDALSDYRPAFPAGVEFVDLDWPQVFFPMPATADRDSLVDEGDRLLDAREAKLRSLYADNLRMAMRVDTFGFERVEFFADGDWRLSPSFNLLLGRNGYGKSLLLRMMVALLKRDLERSRDLFGPQAPDGARFRMRVREAGASGSDVKPKAIVRSVDRFDESVGPVPILAIPDSRFTDRSQTAIRPPADATDLPADGARHFLYQMPYQGLIEEMLFEICLDYRDHGETFDMPVFHFLQEILERLTGEQFTFESIARVGRVDFEMRVRTPGLERDVPIQYSSQGTLSVLAMFSLIRSFLKQVARAATGRDPDEAKIRHGAGIVFIDEIDAHLHPVWQQKIRNLLTDTFPNVQFVVSAHSPLVVAGCGPGEVAVLRPAAGGFEVRLLERDFVGATSRELYEDVFDIEELDETYLEYKTELTQKKTKERRLEKLTATRKEGKLSADENAELARLSRELSKLERVEQVAERRESAESRLQARILDLEAEVERLTARRDDDRGE